MKKIFWITPEGFLDVDMPVLKQLTSEFDIYWLIIGFGSSSKHMFTETEVENYTKQNKIKCEIVAAKYRFRNPLIFFFYLTLIKKLLSFNSDIIYTSYLGEPFFLILLKIFFNKHKVVLAIHDVELHSSERKKQIKKIYHNYVRKHYSNFHLFSSSQVALFIKNFKNKNILLTPLCIKDFGQPTSIIKTEKTRFLFFGNILPYKGLGILIESVNYLAVKHKTRNFFLTIAGNCSASDWKEYQKIIEYPELINTEIRTIKNSEIANFFCNSDYLVLPYKDVTQCGPLMIAYNYNLPVIASDLPGFRDYISEKETGYLFEKNNYVMLAEVMAFCIESNNRDFLARNMIQKKKEIFSLSLISKQYSQYFKKLDS